MTRKRRGLSMTSMLVLALVGTITAIVLGAMAVFLQTYQRSLIRSVQTSARQSVAQVGKTVEEANRSIVGAGLNISISGEQIEGTHQVVSSQTPAAGEQVEAGTVVTIQCVESTAPVTE